MPTELDENQQAQGEQPEKEVSKADGKLLKQIRDDFRYCRDYWKENYDDAADDMQYAACNPWTPADLEDRKGRPCIAPDELSQHVKTANNNARQNKREIVATPKGNGATDKLAQRRESVIRGIQHASKAQSVYTSIYESTAWCGFGFGRINLEYVSESEDHVQARIKRIPNWATVYMDPDAKEPDFSDAGICFVLDSIRSGRFGEKYPGATKKSFSAQDRQVAAEWFDGENLTIAEYYKVTEPPDNRKRGDRRVTHYITNGLEILKKEDWIGSWIPIFGMFGEEIYVPEAGRSKRKFLSLIRRAKGPQKALAYIASQELEEFGMSPRTPFVGYKGVFETDSEAWAALNKVPRAFIQVDIPDTWQPSWGPPPLPTRPQFVPNTQAYEMAYERYRRAVQAAMGLNPLPTAAQRQNEKSGVALEKIQTQEAIGTFHLTDNLDRMLVHVGLQLNELITLTMTNPREVPIQNQDETHGLMWVTSKEHGAPPEAKDDDYLVTDHGEYGITISTGPSFQSQREEQSNFVDVLIGNLKNLPLPPPLAMHLLGLAIKMKNIGPLGEEIAKMLIPQTQDNIPPEAQAAIQQAQGIIQQLQQELQKLMQEKEGKVIENETKKHIALLQSETQRFMQASQERMKMLELETKREIAEISTKAQDLSERRKLAVDLDKQEHVAGTEAASQAAEHAHASDMADKAAETAAVQSDQAHAQTMEQQEQAAKLAPQPDQGASE